MTDLREKIAAIIDPEARLPIWTEDKWNRALTKADIILSTLGSQAVEQPSQLQTDYDALVRDAALRERLCLLFETATLDRDPHTNLNTGTSAEQMADLVLATLPASPIRRRAEEVIELHDPRVIELAGKLFKAEHPNSEWSPGRAAICWFVRAETALNALASAAKASDGESGRG